MESKISKEVKIKLIEQENNQFKKYERKGQRLKSGIVLIKELGWKLESLIEVEQRDRKVPVIKVTLAKEGDKEVLKEFITSFVSCRVAINSVAEFLYFSNYPQYYKQPDESEIAQYLREEEKIWLDIHPVVRIEDEYMVNSIIMP